VRNVKYSREKKVEEEVEEDLNFEKSLMRKEDAVELNEMKS